MTDQTLMNKQRHYFELLQRAEPENRSICQVAKDN